MKEYGVFYIQQLDDTKWTKVFSIRRTPFSFFEDTLRIHFNQEKE